MRTRSLGLGSTTLIAGNDMYGYYGKYQGIITPNALITLAGITQGTTKNDEYNNPNEDITWLKFSHNYKTLFVADRTIHHSISWNHLNSLDLVFGKVVDIGGQKYLLRLLQGANVNPASVSGGANSNDEWDSLIVQFTPNTEDSHWAIDDAVNSSGGSVDFVQETSANELLNVFGRGYTTTANNPNAFSSMSKTSTLSITGYRPVLEVL